MKTQRRREPTTVALVPPPGPPPEITVVNDCIAMPSAALSAFAKMAKARIPAGKSSWLKPAAKRKAAAN
jgi:hypothetical protein